ncbi:hypothetical protein, partial [Ensifer sp. M14]|uniref:hypothetical protein n=1 Tax=Ensifer sp. M14 TaxID=2203782 RepID=UPI001A7E1846
LKDLAGRLYAERPFAAEMIPTSRFTDLPHILAKRRAAIAPKLSRTAETYNGAFCARRRCLQAPK